MVIGWHALSSHLCAVCLDLWGLLYQLGRASRDTSGIVGINENFFSHQEEKGKARGKDTGVARGKRNNVWREGLVVILLEPWYSCYERALFGKEACNGQCYP